MINLNPDRISIRKGTDPVLGPVFVIRESEAGVEFPGGHDAVETSLNLLKLFTGAMPESFFLIGQHPIGYFDGMADDWTEVVPEGTNDDRAAWIEAKIAEVTA